MQTLLNTNQLYLTIEIHIGKNIRQLLLDVLYNKRLEANYIFIFDMKQNYVIHILCAR